MDSYQQRRAAPPRRSTTSPRSRSLSSYSQPIRSHPYAPSHGAVSPSPSFNEGHDGHSHYQHQHMQQRKQYSPQQSQSARGEDPSASPALESPTALQQQYETTRLLSRLLAGVTVQWRQVVERLNDAHVPLTAEQLARQAEESSCSIGTAGRSPLSRSATIDGNTNSTTTYLHGGLHFDVATHARRRERERRRKSLQRAQDEERKQASLHSTASHAHDAHPYNRDRSLAALAAQQQQQQQQQLNSYMDAEEKEREEKEREAERAVAADWTSLTPSAQWVPYVVGRRRSADTEDEWYDGRYDGVLYATSRPLGSGADGRWSARGGASRCAPCDAEEMKNDFDPDNETRLRTAVLHGMARSAETMILGMRQVQHVLPASAAAAAAAVAASPSPQLHNCSPPRREIIGTQRTAATPSFLTHATPSAEAGVEEEWRSTPTRRRRHGSCNGLSRQPVKSAAPSLRRDLSPSPRHQPHHDEESRVVSRRSKRAGEAPKAATPAAPKIIYPAPPAAQRTRIYPRIEEETHIRSNKRGHHGESRHASLHSRRDHRHKDEGGSQPATPTTAHAAALVKQSMSTPVLRDVTPIAEASLGASVASDVGGRRRGELVSAIERGYHGSPPTQVDQEVDGRSGTPGLRVALAGDGRGPSSFSTAKAPTPQEERRSRRATESLPVGEAARLMRLARIAALAHAEAEDRRRIAIQHESCMRTILQAHYHNLWRVHGSRAIQHSHSDQKEKTEHHATRRREELASPVLQSVSVSPFSSPSLTPFSSPVELNVQISNSNSIGTAALLSVATLDKKNSPVRTLKYRPSPLSSSKTNDTSSNSVCTEHLGEEGSLERGVFAAGGPSGPTLSPTPPNAPLCSPACDTPVPPPPRESRSLPPPSPPSSSLAARFSPVPAKTLISPLNEPAARREGQTMPDTNTHIPPPPEPEAHRDATGDVEESASVDPSVFVRRGRRHFVEDALPAPAYTRGGLVALELFPEDPPQVRTSLLCPTQMQQYHSPSPLLLSPSPLPTPLPKHSAQLASVVAPASPVVSPPGTPNGFTSGNEVSFPAQSCVARTQGKQRRSDVRATVATTSASDKMETMVAANNRLDGEEEEMFQRTSSKPITTSTPTLEDAMHSPGSGRSRSESSSSASSSSSSSSGSSASGNTQSTSLRYEVESASPLAPGVEEEVEEVTNYSSVSSFYSNVPECLTSAPEAVVSADARPSPEPNTEVPAKTTQIELPPPSKIEPESGDTAIIPPDSAMNALDQTSLADVVGDARADAAASPLPRPPTPKGGSHCSF